MLNPSFSVFRIVFEVDDPQEHKKKDNESLTAVTVGYIF